MKSTSTVTKGKKVNIMTNKETRALISRMAFNASEYNYYVCKGEREKASTSDIRYETLFHFSLDMKEHITTVKDSDGFYSAIGCDLGGGKYYIEWCTSCNVYRDDVTFRTFQEFAKEKESRGYTVYTTDGKNGMSKMF